MDRRHALLRAGKRPREPAVGIAIFHTGPPVRRRDYFPWAPAGREKFRSRYAEESTLLAAGGPPVRRRHNFPWAPAGRENFRSRSAEESTLLAAGDKNLLPSDDHGGKTKKEKKGRGRRGIEP